MIFFTSYLSLIFLDVPEMSKQKMKPEEEKNAATRDEEINIQQERKSFRDRKEENSKI